VVQPVETTTYIVVGTLGTCIDTDTVTVTVNPIDFKLPNAFSPNGDDSNEAFGPLAAGIEILAFKVWNRWGQIQHDNPAQAWNGTSNGQAAPSDVYVYYILTRYPDGREEAIEGDVTLLR
jgi:gliding motility-associated-like protein